jgi:hypothetical protein
MGQYYKAIFLSNDGNISRWTDSQGGSKLMEHSYTNDPFVLFIQRKLYRHPRRLVWAGDYADPEPMKEDLESAIKALRLLANYRDQVLECDAHYVEHALKMLKRRYTEGFDTDDCICMTFALKFTNNNLYYMCHNAAESCMTYDSSSERDNRLHKYIINHTLKEYVDMNKYIGSDDGSDDHVSPWHSRTPSYIHPLPLLTAETGTGGGGDYRGEAEEDVGIWARHLISTEDMAPEGYAERIVKFKEY